MHAIEVQTIFSAAHALRLPGGALEPLHGHDFQVTVRISAQSLDALETVLDFHEVETALDAIVAPWKSRNLNDIEPFRTTMNPSAERIAEEIGKRLESGLLAGGDRGRGLRLQEVRITEAPRCIAIWSPD